MSTKTAIFFDPRPVLPSTVAATRAGRLLTAASITMAVLRKSKVATLAELAAAPDRIPASVRIEKSIARDIIEFAPTLAVLYQPVTGVKDGPAALALVVCTECGRWSALSGGGAPSKCNLTLSCTGKPTKASAAVARKPPTAGPGEDEIAADDVHEHDLEDDDEYDQEGEHEDDGDDEGDVVVTVRVRRSGDH